MADPIDYQAVLADLKTRKAALEQAIAAVESILGDVSTPIAGGGFNGVSKTIQPDTFIGMNILQATTKFLQMMGRPARKTEQIAEALNQGGLSVSQGSVSTILRRSENSDNPVIRVGPNLWGLAEWYPGRPR